jgi:hypothetical protein
MILHNYGQSIGELEVWDVSSIALAVRFWGHCGNHGSFSGWVVSFATFEHMPRKRPEDEKIFICMSGDLWIVGRTILV